MSSETKRGQKLYQSLAVGRVPWPWAVLCFLIRSHLIFAVFPFMCDVFWKNRSSSRNDIAPIVIAQYVICTRILRLPAKRGENSLIFYSLHFSYKQSKKSQLQWYWRNIKETKVEAKRGNNSAMLHLLVRTSPIKFTVLTHYNYALYSARCSILYEKKCPTPWS